MTDRPIFPRFPIRCARRGAVLLAVGLSLALPPGARPARADGGFAAFWQGLFGGGDTQGIASSNGRIEAQSVEVATKYAGRIAEVLVDEGSTVEAGQVIARIDDRDAQAQLLGAKAAVLRAEAAREVAKASVMQAQSALDVARTNRDRVARLHEDGHASDSSFDDARNALTSAEATLASARAQVSDAEALIASSNAEVERLQIALDDLTILAPIRGRVLYRLHEPGEVVAAGTPVVTLLDLTDVYMNIYLPAPVVGLISANDEARLILDPIPDYIVPARVTFVSPESQFTPKSVETLSEREDLVFRVKLTIPRELLVKFEDKVKTGVRGQGFVRTDPDRPWPETLQVPESLQANVPD
ncbi:efflux transporter periplasmic adaptor subunit [Rhodovulum sulfidophilum]|uniref:HlyD family efflux transporter periplasmic adaptor subunit n=1 Tax=Rhodovulum visakhapatnamense TaxID=364297 RepID=A0ABS1RCF0_9RHOB|nr:HlyD family efflux transporter periplasmic adaptor subunit [Rhodovulum visakhapatnamense]MBL3568106.1 HlyD family efflux transporter periplasmic adaptor subunit [Rhodovulum visakhapatnamense]MBL3577174.1 HlyD family efflux transporter periplasmic adaptor subunit [Rhodovulum visakhapatnamense]OLS45678.1 efflux transporter periplasmic adaptor subunit [Rhodovulum sulfidophilum]